MSRRQSNLNTPHLLVQNDEPELGERHRMG